MQHVVKIVRDSDGAPMSTDLTELLVDFSGATPNTKTGEVRDADEAELDAMAETLAELRTAIGALEQISYHVCRHDEGIGNCSAAVVTR